MIPIMAKRIDPKQIPARAHGRPSSYRWEEWLDGSTWELIQAEDFPDTRPARFSTTARHQAAMRGADVKVTARGDRVFITPNGATPAE